MFRHQKQSKEPKTADGDGDGDLPDVVIIASCHVSLFNADKRGRYKRCKPDCVKAAMQCTLADSAAQVANDISITCYYH